MHTVPPFRADHVGSLLHYRGGRAAIDPAVYPDLEEFWRDLERVYADQIEALSAGLRPRSMGTR